MELAVAARIASEYTGRIRLSVFPFMLEKLLDARRDPAADPGTLARLVKMDPALCFMALHLDRVMNPRVPFPAPPSLDAALTHIGQLGVDAIITRSASETALNGIHRQQGMALGWLWRHGLSTALLARELAHATDLVPPEDAYAAGLLHGIGRLALVARTPASCIAMLADPGQAAALLEAEARVVGADYGRIGAWLIRRHTAFWSAADAAEYATAAVAVIRNALPLVQVVWAACHLTTARPHPSSENDGTVSELLRIPHAQLRELVDNVAADVADTVKTLDIVPLTGETGPDHGRLAHVNRVLCDRAALSIVYEALLTATTPETVMRVLQIGLSVFWGIDALLVMADDPANDRLIGGLALGKRFPMPPSRLAIPLSATDCIPVNCLTSGSGVSSFRPARPNQPTIVDQQLMAYMETDGMLCLPFSTLDGTGRACLILGIQRCAWPDIVRQQSPLTGMIEAVGASLGRLGRLKTRAEGEVADYRASEIARFRRIVHEINNPLGIIKNYLNVLAKRGAEMGPDKEALRLIGEELDRASTLINSLTAPSTAASSTLAAVDLNAVINDLVDLFRDGLPSTAAIRWEADLEEHAPMIATDRDRLKQVLMNLLKNAMEAMPQGGTVQVRTRLFDRSGRSPARPDQAHLVRISVCDDGPGVDEDIKNDLFNPHVTTKTGHDGLGLAIVHETVMHFKGSLRCESVPGRGTCFHIDLPTGSGAV